MMPGFSVSIGNYDFSLEESCPKLIYGHIDGKGFSVQRFTLNKFINDKIFYSDERCIMVLEGVILNKIDFLNNNEGLSWESIVWKLYIERGQDFFKLFRGSFSGLLYDKQNDIWIIFTDHIGSKHLYYYIRNDQFFVSSEILNMYRFVKEIGLKCDLNTNAAYMLLSYGYMLDDNTLYSDVKKLLAGHYIQIRDGEVKIMEYYKLPLSFVSSDYNEDQIIDELDKRFRKAIELQFEKDKEYDLRHFVALSGGLDSRMTSWVAHEMGYVDQINFTFSQSGYLDETIPKQISADLKHDWVFKSLDNGLFLKDIEDISLITGGNVLYYGLAHAHSLFKLLNFEDLGIVHSGQLGDVVMGSYIKKLDSEKNRVLDGAYSKKLLSKILRKEENLDSVESLELAMIYQRGFNGINSGLLASQRYTETVSPFYDIDLFEFCLSIPLNFRVGHDLYKKWILTKYPKAADYIWETTKRRIDAKSLNIKYREREMPVSMIFPFLWRKLITSKGKPSKYHMNPMNYWYATNSQLRLFQDSYFGENICYLRDYPELKNDCTTLYENGSAIEKNQVLTLLSALKLFCRL